MYCSKCKGSGKIICPTCGGQGRKPDPARGIAPCPTCLGEGKVKCPNCGGSGR